MKPAGLIIFLLMGCSIIFGLNFKKVGLSQNSLFPKSEGPDNHFLPNKVYMQDPLDYYSLEPLLKRYKGIIKVSENLNEVLSCKNINTTIHTLSLHDFAPIDPPVTTT